MPTLNGKRKLTTGLLMKHDSCRCATFGKATLVFDVVPATDALLMGPLATRSYVRSIRQSPLLETVAIAT